MLLKCKANCDGCNSLGLTPLMIASIEGHTDIIELLLEYNAEPTLIDEEGKTAYIHAKENAQFKAMELLPENTWNLEKDPKWQKLVAETVALKEEQNAKKNAKKDKKGGAKKK